ncbi:hypothetical protein [Rhizobium sullae]|uniref:hypothetical protein n=1 Tax=Rhizobium sullae TaxID=50338 RepID=UPI0018E2016A|nr:hypothetical protein [Rhizobium sullae]
MLPMIGDRRLPSPLDAIQPDHWLCEYTADLTNLLHVLGRLVRLEPRQADLPPEEASQYRTAFQAQIARLN